jgi:acetyltransferase
MTIRNLEYLLAPKSVTLIGASPEAGSVGNIVARNLLAGGFRGPIRFVNPRHAMIEGQRSHSSAADLPEAPDLAVVVTPPSAVPRLIGGLGARGTRAAVVITAGIGREARDAMLRAAKPNILRIQGPNCLGLMLPALGLDASFSHKSPLAGDLAFLSQSGALITSIVDWASPRAIGFSHIVSLGDMADVDFGDLLDYLAADVASRAILLYVESVTHAPKFMSAARRAARAKPVIVIKSGRHAAGARAALSHTGALAGSDSAYDAAFRRAGLLRVRELEELFDAAEMISRVPRLPGERLMVLTNGGGAGVLAADRLADWGGVLAPLSPETLAKLDGVLPATWSKGNPVDIIGDAKPERYGQALDALLADPAADAILVLNCPTALADSTAAAEATIAAIARQPKVTRRKPVLTGWLGDGAAEPARALFRKAGVAAFETPDDAVNGFMQLVRYSRAQSELMRAPPALPPGLVFDAAAARELLAGVLASGRNTLTETEAKALLAAYGIPTVPTRVAATPGEVAGISRGLLSEYGAVAVKIASRDISHKSDVGGVRLGLATAEEAAEAARLMLARIASLVPDARIDGFAVQPMIRRPRAHELLLGMSVDATFGPLVTFGAGGTAVEVVRDTAQALPPLDLGLARDLMRQTRSFRLLEGYRDRKAADLDAIALTLVRLSCLVSEHREIRELDINPLLADEKGVIALDARVAVADPAREPRVPMAIRPYPTQWEAGITLDGGRAVEIRPIRPDDEALYARFFSGVSASDSRLRFFLPVKELSHAFVARLTQIDYAREMAFVAIGKDTGELLGVVRFAADPDYRLGEFAVLVQSGLKGKGLGWQLMHHLVRYARAEGLSELYGTVLAENTTMLQMCRELGFSIAAVPDDLTLRHVRLPLAT